MCLPFGNQLYPNVEGEVEPMADYTLFVGGDVSAQTVSIAWGTEASAISAAVSFDQTEPGYSAIVARLRRLKHDPARTLVVLEATGTYWMRLAYRLHEAGFVVSVINPAQAHYFAQAQLRRAKTDALDAQLLAQVACTLRPAPWTPPPPIYDVLYQCLTQRDAFVAMRTQERNRLHAVRRRQTPHDPVVARLEDHIAYLSHHIDTLDRDIRQHLAAHPDWAATARRLQTIQGIGPVTAAWLLVATLNFTTCHSPDQLTAFAGLAPHPRQSGTSLTRHRAVGHGGHARLRSALYLAAVSAIRANPVLRRFYRHLLDQGKLKKVALCAVARKLLHIAWAVATKQRVFDPAWAFAA